MISVRNVSKDFDGILAVRDISFEVSQGQNFVLLGTSGCGKTTTLRMINRLIEPSEGIIFIDNENIANKPPEQLRRKIGYVLQHNSLFPHYTVARNIAVVPELLRWDRSKTDLRIQELLIKLHLKEDYLYKYPQQLSGGEAQRVNIARALVANPSVLLMDEPFGALDTITRAAIRKEFLELDELIKTTIVMVTHDVQEAFEMGDIICLMDKGEVMQTGSPAELLFSPANDFVRDFLSDAFLPLSFLITKVHDVWEYIESPHNVETLTSKVLQSSVSLWKAFEQIKDKNDENSILTIIHTGHKEQKQMRWDDLLNAFSKYQKRRSWSSLKHS